MKKNIIKVLSILVLLTGCAPGTPATNANSLPTQPPSTTATK